VPAPRRAVPQNPLDRHRPGTAGDVHTKGHPMGSRQQGAALRLPRYVAHHVDTPGQPAGSATIPVSFVLGPGGALPFAVRHLGPRRWALVVGDVIAADVVFRTYGAACAAARVASGDLVADLEALACGDRVA
jgi:hypothetical protein